MRRRLALVGLLAFAFVLPWEDAVVLPGIGSIGRLTGLVLVALALPQFFDGSRFTLRSPPLAVAALAAFALWSVTTLLWTLDPVATTRSVTTLAQLIVMVFLLWQLCDTEVRRRAAMQAYVLGGYVAVVDAFVNYVTGQEASFRRFAATGFDPNDFAVILALGIPMAWQLAKGTGVGWAIVNLAYLPAALLAILLSASRGGTIAAAVGLLAVLSGLRGLPTATRRAALVVGALLVAAAPFAAPLVQSFAESSLYRLGTIASGLSTGSLNERGVIWRSGFEAFPERPVVGVGLGAFPAAVERNGAAPEVAHNSFLSVLVETGVVGALLFGVVLLTVLVPLWRAPAATRWPNLVLFGTLMVAMLPLSWELRKPTWFVLGLLVAYRGAQLVTEPFERRAPLMVGGATEVGASEGGRFDG